MPVWFMGEYQESMLVSLYPDPKPKESVPPLMQCQTPCGGRMKRARYHLQIPDTADTVGGVRRIDVKGPSRFVISTHSRTNHTNGLAVGLSGAAVSLTGLVLFLHGALTNRPNLFNTEMGVGGGMMFAGGILTAIGFAVYNHNGQPDIRFEPMVAESVWTRHAGVVPVRSGVGIAGTGVF